MSLSHACISTQCILVLANVEPNNVSKHAVKTINMKLFILHTGLCIHEHYKVNQ